MIDKSGHVVIVQGGNSKMNTILYLYAHAILRTGKVFTSFFKERKDTTWTISSI